MRPILTGLDADRAASIENPPERSSTGAAAELRAQIAKWIDEGGAGGELTYSPDTDGHDR